LTRPTGRRALRVGFGVLAFAALVYATVSQWSEVGDALDRASTGGLLLALAGMVAGTFCSMLSWRAVLADLGSPLGPKAAVRIFFVGQLGKYLPGSLWPVVAQMELGRSHGVPRKRSAVAALLVIVVALTAGGLLAAATLPWAAAGELRPYRWVFLAPAAGLVLLVPSVFAKVTTFGLRILRRQPLEQGLSGRGVVTALAWAVAQWALWGVPVWLLTDASLPLVLGAYALAWIAGFVFLVAPAGAGVREAALVLLLGPAIGNDAALGVAIVARLLTTVADLFWGLVALASYARRRGRSPERV
jgi:uncharacterized membrane protein YbhN (UPF0104 family)